MLELKNVNKKYTTKGGVVVNALDDVSMYFEDKGMVFVLGKSGSGKSTLLNVIGGLDRYDSGEIIIKDRSSTTFKGSDFDSYRNTFIGFIFQEYNILEEFSVKKNIGLALELQGKNADDVIINKILEAVDMQGLGDRKPNTLSGGQKQRVAIARALVKNPEIIMADEPTGALDSNTGKQVFDTLKKLSKEKLVVIVSHDRDFAEKYADRIIELADGKVISDVKKTAEIGKKINEDVSVISDSILAIKKGAKLEVKDLDAINKFLETHNEDVFITANKKINNDIKTVANIEGGDNFSFKNTKDNEFNKKVYKKDDFKLIRSKLPFKHSFKIGASSLKVKPVRLIFTILLASIAFAFFGLSDTIGQFSRVNTAVDVLQNESVTTAAITKITNHNYDGYSYEETGSITVSEVNALKLKFPDSNFKEISTNANFSIQFSNCIVDQNSFNMQNYYSYSTRGMVGFTNSEFENSDLKMLYGTYPSSANEIALSRFVASTFVDYGYIDPSGNEYEISNISEMVGKNIGDNEHIISGIVDTGIISSIYDSLKVESIERDYNLAGQFEGLKQYSYHNLLFVNSDFVISNAPDSLINYSEVNGLRINETNFERNVNYIKEYNQSDAGNIIFIDENKTSLTNNEVIIPLYIVMSYIDFTEFAGMESSFNYDSLEHGNISFDEYMYYIANNSYQLDLNQLGLFYTFVENNKTIIMSNINETIIKYYYYDFNNRYAQEISGEFNVVGFSKNLYSNCYSYCDFIVTQNNYDSFVGETSYGFVLGSLPSSKGELLDFIKESYKFTPEGNNTIRFGLINTQVTMLDEFYSMIKIMAKVFFYIGLGFAVFSALLMLNFISTSIAYKKREIGILRAIGARSNDVFGIFFNESFLIASINTFIAIIFSIVACYFLNDMMKTELNYNANFLFFGIRQIVLIFGISVFTAFIASLLPVKKIAAKKPIDAIKGR